MCSFVQEGFFLFLKFDFLPFKKNRCWIFRGNKYFSFFRPPFDLGDFRSRVLLDRDSNAFPVNRSWYEDHGVIGCPARTFRLLFSFLFIIIIFMGKMTFLIADLPFRTGSASA